MERNRCGSNSGGVVKNRSSSGCLIVKKKPDGMVGGSSGGRKRHDLEEEKVRVRLRGSDSVSSDEELLDTYKRREGVRDDQISSTPLVYKRGVGNHGDFSNKMSDFGDVVFSNRNSLDVYDFDEYDDLSDVERIGVRHYYDRDIGGSESWFLTPRQGFKSGSGLEFESGSSKGDIIYRRRNSFSGGRSGEKSKDSDQLLVKRKFEGKPELPVLTGKEKYGGSSESIRLQGKNGVLKVMVKHNKEKVDQQRPQNRVRLEGNKNVSRSHDIGSENRAMRSSVYLERKLQKKPMVIGKLDNVQERKRKSILAKGSEDSDGESEDSDSSPQLPSDSLGVQRPIKKGRIGVSIPMSEDTQQIKPNGRKVRRGCGTEKQKLREKIRNMLMSAGWTIDYRPRRGRDYSDAVYVNPAGTAYWSIIKAYEALQKQLEEEGTSLEPGDGCDTIADDIMSKLTRQTKRKIEREFKRKKREEVGGKRKKQSRTNSEEDESDTDSNGSGRRDDKLSSFIKRSGKSLKGASKESCHGDGRFPSSKPREKGEKSSSMSNIKFINGRESTKFGRCTLLVRNAEKGLDSNSDGFVLYSGKRNLLSWLIDSGAVQLSEKVHYMNRRRTRVMLEGWIAKDGIHCGCCSKIISISKFEIHASSKLRQPFQNIYLSSGASLLQCQVDAWNRQDISQRNGFYEIDVDGEDPNDDTCSICGDGGNLICCDSCPSTYHQNCLGIQVLPPGDWHCLHCSCRFCGLADVSLMKGNGAREYTLLSCNLCEGKYHASCIEEIVDTSVNSNPASFCGKKCQEVFEHLQKLLGVKHELDAGLCWSLVHRTDLDSDTSGLRHPQRVEWNSKIAVALTVMEECFLPVIDRRSGINMIHNVLYNCGSNFTRLNYSGFYTAILEKGDEIVSAASIRIRGNQCAEMPFIGTRHIYRHQGMCRRLFYAIESTLRTLKVEKLIIPAISELMDTWTRVFGFSPLGDRDKLKLNTFNVLAFPGTDTLQKKLVDYDSLRRDLAGEASLEAGNRSPVVPESPNKYELNISPEPSRAAALSDNDVKNGQSVTDFCSQDAVASVEETSKDIDNEDKPCDVSCKIQPLTTTEGGQGTISSSLQSDTKCDESAVKAKVQNFPGIPADVPYFGIRPSSMTQNVMKAEAGARPLETGIPYSVTSDALLTDFLGNDKHVVPSERLCSENESAVDMESCSLSETSCGVGTMEEPSTSLPAEGTIQDSIRADYCSLSDTSCDVGTLEKPSTSLLAERIILDSIKAEHCILSDISCNVGTVEKPSASLTAEGIIQDSIKAEHYSLSDTSCDVGTIEKGSSSLPAEGITQDSIKAEHCSLSDTSCDVGSAEKPSTSVPAEGIIQDSNKVEYCSFSETSCDVGTVKKPHTSIPPEGIIQDSIQTEHSLSETSCDVCTVENPSTSLPAEGIIQDSIKTEVNVGFEIPAKVTDLCSSSQATEHLTAPVDAVVVEPQPESCNGDSCLHDLGGKVHREISSIQSAGNCDTSDQNIVTVGVVKNCRNNPQGDKIVERSLDSFAEGSGQPFSEAEVLRGHDIGLKLANVQSQCRLSCELSGEIDNSCDAKESSGQMLEDEMHHNPDISVKSACPQSACKFEANSHYDENPASL